MKKVQAFVAVEITPGPFLEEESLKDGLYGFRYPFLSFSIFCKLACQNSHPLFRNIACWKNGDLQLMDNPRVTRWWSGSVPGDEVPELQASPSPRHWSCLSPDSGTARPRPPKRPFENVSPTSRYESVQAGSAVSLDMLNDFYLSRWTDQEILDTNLTERQKAHLESLEKSTPLLLRKAYEMQHRELNLRTFRESEMNGKIPKRFLCNSNGGVKRRRLDNGNTIAEGISTIFGEGLPVREEAIHQIDSRTPIVRTLDQILAALVMKQAACNNGHLRS